MPLPRPVRLSLLVLLLSACSSAPAPRGPTAALDGTLIVEAGDFAEASDLALLPGGDRVVAIDFAGALALHDRRLTGDGPGDALVARIDAAGRTRWLVALTGPGAEAITAVPAAPGGGLVVSGRNQRDARLGDRRLDRAGAFVVRIDDRGQLLTLAQLSGDLWLADAAAAADGSLCAAGWFGGELRAGGATERVMHSAGSHDVLIACFTPDGALAWTRRAGGSGADQATAIAIAGDQVIAVGGFSRLADFDGAELPALRGHPDGFAAAWSLADGSPQWRQRFGGPDRDTATAVAVDRDGTTWVAGSFTGKAVFGPAVLEADGEGAFIAAIGADGELRLARPVLAGAADATAIALTGAGPIVAGTFAGDVDAGGRALRATGSRDIYVVALDAAASPRWARRLGGHDQDGVGGLAADGDTLAIAGSFVDRLDAGGRELRASGQAAFTALLPRR